MNTTPPCSLLPADTDTDIDTDAYATEIVPKSGPWFGDWKACLSHRHAHTLSLCVCVSRCQKENRKKVMVIFGTPIQNIESEEQQRTD